MWARYTKRLTLKPAKLGRYNEWLAYGTVERIGASPTDNPALRPWKVRKVEEPGAGIADNRRPSRGTGKGPQEGEGNDG